MSAKKESKTVTDDIDLENDDSIVDLTETTSAKKEEDSEVPKETEDSKAEKSEDAAEEAETKKEEQPKEETTTPTTSEDKKKPVAEAKEEETKDKEEAKPTPPAKKKESIGLTVYDPEPLTSTKETPPAPPPKPQRPLTPRQESFKTLKEAFPTFEDKLIQTVLIASGFRLESSFNALLYYTDPSTVNIEEVAVETSEVIQQQATEHDRAEDLLKQDELLAKQLDEEFKRKERRRLQRQQQQHYETQRRQQQPQQQQSFRDNDEEDDIFTNLIEKDIPQLKQQFNKNLQETKTKFSNWFNSLNNAQEQPEFRQGDFRPQEFKTQKNQRNGQFNYDYEEPEELDMSKFQNIKLTDNDRSSKSRLNDEEDLYKPALPSRNSANSASNKKSWEPISVAKTTTGTTLQDDDDDFLLSEDEDRTSAKK
ncbi:hypothetical protein WICPIJ_000943 [Wickerhamomyces pijperi]|uniref:CUE domain-containing protein n=1 Tax=Wickerhamomyces pijperi TaxID=599730 RepID=A0A9P8TRW4_WICPI|nr:hypothetical protein WICPIJ_000943 [Wickerhamomyces pijperi]